MKNQKHAPTAQGRRRLPVQLMVATLAVLILAATGAAATAAAKSTARPPTKPAWVRDDGTIDTTKMPRTLHVVGPDGKLITDANGDPVDVPNPDLDVPVGDPEPPFVDIEPFYTEEETLDTDPLAPPSG